MGPYNLYVRSALANFYSEFFSLVLKYHLVIAFYSKYFALNDSALMSFKSLPRLLFPKITIQNISLYSFQSNTAGVSH